jgi:hypothetical protein
MVHSAASPQLKGPGRSSGIAPGSDKTDVASPISIRSADRRSDGSIFRAVYSGTPVLDWLPRITQQATQAEHLRPAHHTLICTTGRRAADTISRVEQGGLPAPPAHREARGGITVAGGRRPPPRHTVARFDGTRLPEARDLQTRLQTVPRPREPLGFPDHPGIYLARDLTMVWANKPRRSLPRITGPTPEGSARLEFLRLGALNGEGRRVFNRRKQPGL